MADSLTEAGFKTVNQGYPSRHAEIKTLTQEAIPPALKACGDSTAVSFVTHSLGGILVRQYLSETHIPNLNHVVMLGPPNQGSEVVDTLGDVPGFKLMNGPAGMQLGTSEVSVPNALGPVNFSLGVIAGTRTFNPILSMILPNPNDGKVSVESTKIEGMKDHMTMPVTHTFMMRNQKVIQQVAYFLQHGRFEEGL